VVRARLDLSPLSRTHAPEVDAGQRAVIDHRDGPLLVLAGPGTGKTTTIVESVVGRLEAGQSAEEVLVLTFGRRAAGEVRDRIAARIGGGLLPTVATFHSFAYGLVRAHAGAEQYVDPPRLLSGAEEDLRIRELIMGSLEDGTIAWPQDLQEAIATEGFAAEVRALVARMRERDITPARLRALAAEHARPEWNAVADIAEQEEDVMVLHNVMDYAELMRRAVLLAGDESVRRQLHERITAVYVDEFQDTDPLQVELLRRIAGPGCSVVAVGDPDQAIYAFRGAQVQGFLDFPDTFRQPGGQPAPVIALRTVRRYGSVIADAARAALAPRTLGTLPVDAQRDHRSPEFVDHDPSMQGSVRVLSCPTHSSRDAHIAEQIRSAHVHDRLAWQDMAVLVRSADDLAGVERALSVAGVPASITADELPLHEEPAVAVLLTLIEIAARPRTATPERIEDLLLGPIGRMDVSDLRRLGRALRAQRRDAGEPVLPARELVADLVLGRDAPPAGIDSASALAASVDRVRDVLAAVREGVSGGASIGEVLWVAWTGGSSPHGWPERLRAAALGGSASAHHDLDAVIALFASAERLSERYRGVYAVTTFLDTLRDQAIASESITESSHARVERESMVQIMTVHRAKGLEWKRVWITGLEEGRWPNVQPRGSLLGVEELASADRVAPDLMREERNLLFVAMTRAREQVTLLPVDSADEGADRPSRFIADVIGTKLSNPRHNDEGHSPLITVEALPHRGDVITSWSQLVIDCRRALMDADSSADTRRHAASLLARIATLRDRSGAPLIPAADPAHWWGMNDVSEGPRPLRAPNAPIALSGSSLDAIRQCSMKWFLDHEAHADAVRSSATAFGSIVHAIADHVARGEIPEDLRSMEAFVDRVWSEVDFDAPWRSVSERTEARHALERFLIYHQARERTFIDSERYIVSDLDVPTPAGAPESVHLRGYLDRIEEDDDGRLVAIDFKTSSSSPTKKETQEHGQLGVYQLLLRDAYEAADGAHHDVGGAALVQLRMDAGAKDPGPKQQMQLPLTTEAADDPRGLDGLDGLDGLNGVTWIERALGEAANTVRRERIEARPGKHCTFCDFAGLCPAKTPEVSVIDLVGDINDVMDVGGDDE